ncbi:MAG: single-strand DNA-binding protein [Verrucomicrobiales bacterium]|jgi:single-strand DNA-binding protein
MASVNKVILIGNLTRTPELRYTPKGTAVTEVSLACNRKYRVDNEMREEVTYVEITFWGAQAETISKYLEKGSPLYCEGRLRLESWDDKETGKKRSKLSVVGENFQFLGGGRGGGASGPMNEEDGGGQSYSAPAQQQSSAPPAGSSPPPSTGSGPLAEEEDDIPF